MLANVSRASYVQSPDDSKRELSRVLLHPYRDDAYSSSQLPVQATVAEGSRDIAMSFRCLVEIESRSTITFRHREFLDTNQASALGLKL